MPSSAFRSTPDSVPAPIARLAQVMAGFEPDWCLCGGWAVDAGLGFESRKHKDVDIAIFQDDLDALREHFKHWRLNAHDALEPDSEEQWVGRQLYLPAHVHARLEGDDFELDVQVNERSNAGWLLKSDAGLSIPFSRCVAKSLWSLPTLVPEMVLFYKALDVRTQDEADFQALTKLLSVEQRVWLRETIALVRAEHPWLARLSESSP